jgi:hypothetical protein
MGGIIHEMKLPVEQNFNTIYFVSVGIEKKKRFVRPGRYIGHNVH